ncbi:hypothetical protein V2J70_02145 [Pseudomonas alliivorans]|nr:hypothetical protein [Pseudomonas alliivorans]
MDSDDLIQDLPEGKKVNQDQLRKALKVPADALIDYLNRVAPDNKCSFCGVGEYGVVPAPTGGTAGVIATPVPNIRHLGVWFFFATCTTCSHTVFFNAPLAMKKMAEEH